MNFDPAINYYQVLGVDRAATKPEIVARFNSITNPSNEVKDAYRVLSSDSLRQMYNAWTSDDEDEIFFEGKEVIQPAVVTTVAPATAVTSENDSTPAPESFLSKWLTCFVILIFGVFSCIISTLFGIGNNIGSTAFFTLMPPGIFLVIFLFKRGRITKKGVFVLGIIVVAIVAVGLLLQAFLKPVVKGPQDIIDSINNSAGSILNIQSTLAKPGAEALEVNPTAQNKEVNAGSLCGAASSLLKISGTTITIVSPENWVDSTEFNVRLFWNIDGNIKEIDPTQVKSFRKLKTVFLDHIDVTQNGSTTTYPCR